MQMLSPRYTEVEWPSIKQRTILTLIWHVRLYWLRPILTLHGLRTVMVLSSQSLQVSSVQVRVRVWAKPCSVLKCISRPRDWNVRSCCSGATVIWRVPWRRLSRVGGVLWCWRVSVCKGWQSAKVKLCRCALCALPACVYECANVWISVYSMTVCLCLSFAGCVGVRSLFVEVYFDFNTSKEGAACSAVTGSKANRPN